jgi:hypothetical protein
MDDYARFLKDNHVTMLPAPPELEANAYYIHDVKLLFIKVGLSEIDYKNAIMHEIDGHLAHHHIVTKLTPATVISKMEHEADEEVIQNYVKEYFDSCTMVPSFIDVNNFLKVRHLRSDLYDTAQELLYSFMKAGL